MKQQQASACPVCGARIELWRKAIAAGRVATQCGSCRSGLCQSKAVTKIQWALLLMFVISAYIFSTLPVVIIGMAAIAAMLAIASKHQLQIIYIAPGTQQGATAEPSEKPGGGLS
jgi:hypothetical protein